jgi:hypothetical protein
MTIYRQENRDENPETDGGKKDSSDDDGNFSILSKRTVLSHSARLSDSYNHVKNKLGRAIRA